MSDAVGSERISKIVGYKIIKGDFKETSPNLPQRIAILGEANTANQVTLSLTPVQVTSAQQAAKLYGFGSPIHMVMRILRPNNSAGVGGIPTWVYPQAVAAGATSKLIEVTPAGTATANGTHTLIIAGRNGVDGVFYDLNINTGDTVAVISGKISDAVNAVLSSPVSGSAVATNAILTSKWEGLTAEEINVTVDTGDDDLGITYAVASSQAGSGTPSVQAALDLFGNEWNTVVINSYGAVTSVMDTLEAFNGKPLETSPTGRYQGIVFKPFIALTGSLLDDPTTITDSKKEEVTIAICPAPLSKGFTMEAAANMARLFARVTQDNPHLDVSGQSYPDMPTPAVIGSMENYENRDAFVKKGSSTVELANGSYKVADFVTTYHPDGELPPQFRYCRNLMIDFNVRFGYFLLEAINVVDKAIVADGDTVTVGDTIKPKQWIQIIDQYAESLSKKALTVQPEFTQDSIEVDISSTNPDRLETFFRYKRSGFARISSTTAEAGFNFGNV